jgi:hypothetical protein
MKTALEQLPPQETGRQTDFTHEQKFEGLDDAHHAFQAAAGRLLSVSNWPSYAVPAPRSLRFVTTRARHWT